MGRELERYWKGWGEGMIVGREGMGVGREWEGRG